MSSIRYGQQIKMNLDDIEEDEVAEVNGADKFMTVFFVFDSVLENSEMQSNAALELFKKIQSESLN
ncbi:MAG: hypothetical protein ACOC53_02135 [Candidatus Saliniplasma sp.]